MNQTNSAMMRPNVLTRTVPFCPNFLSWSVGVELQNVIQANTVMRMIISVEMYRRILHLVRFSSCTMRINLIVTAALLLKYAIPLQRGIQPQKNVWRNKLNDI